MIQIFQKKDGLYSDSFMILWMIATWSQKGSFGSTLIIHGLLSGAQRAKMTLYFWRWLLITFSSSWRNIKRRSNTKPNWNDRNQIKWYCFAKNSSSCSETF